LNPLKNLEDRKKIKPLPKLDNRKNMTTTQKTANRLERQIKFLESLHRRINSDNGAKATLKRALSGEERHIRNSYSIILPHIPDVTEWQQEIWILVACLSGYYPQTLDRESQQNFGCSCRGLANATSSEGADRRFRALLDTALEDLRSPLTALIRQIKIKEVRIDYPKLLADLCQWDHPDQYIQDRWARTFWGASNIGEEASKSSSENEDFETLDN
jgi:CRISPR system Cascade subunit CasB